MMLYFGFGSNMSMASLKTKGVRPRASCKATLPGWRLRFNVQHFFHHEGGVGNIEYTGNPADQVMGVLHACTDDALPLLDAAEAYGHGYDRIKVDVLCAASDVKAFNAAINNTSGATEPLAQTTHTSPKTITAITYIGMPEFINDQCQPSRRYLNILLDGSRQAQLDSHYIEVLAQHPVHICEEYPIFKPPSGEYPTFNAVSLAQYPLYTALADAVFDMSQARPLHTFLKGYFGGKDMTLFHLQRLNTQDTHTTMDDVRNGRLNRAQQQHLNAYLNEYAREYRFVGHYHDVND